MRNKKVILITGASSGMGFVTAKKLIQQGHIVYGAARRIERMAELEELGGKVLALDITDEQSTRAAVEKVISEQGRIDVLWNNAGFGLWGSVEDITIDEARYQFEVNLFGLARITQLVLPYMRERKTGTIINTSSMGGKVYMPLGSWYHATKHALEGWSDCLRLEVQEFGINVVVLEPGAIETEFGNPVIDKLKEKKDNSAYKELMESFIIATEKSYKEPGNSSSPEVIANTVAKIVKHKRPSTRYLVGKYAKPMVFLRRLIGDRLFDRVVMSTVKSVAAQ